MSARDWRNISITLAGMLMLTAIFLIQSENEHKYCNADFCASSLFELDQMGK